jgi:uncharacterized protein (TIGR01319 family)
LFHLYTEELKGGDAMSHLATLIDFGSTFTKGVVFDLENNEIAAQSRTFSTVSSDVMEGLETLEAQLRLQSPGYKLEDSICLACSSAAGGLRMVVIGLIPEMTVEAGCKAAYNAGAKIVGSFTGIMEQDDLDLLRQLEPDLILLSGGTDGGNHEVITSNAERLSEITLSSPVIIGGNKNAAKDCAGILKRSGYETYVTQNVMPKVGTLNIEPAREMIREVFIDRISLAKGIAKAKERVSLLMTTPDAVLRGVELIAKGTSRERGFGELLAVDVGGATTDIYSAAEGAPRRANVILKDQLPEPYVKRSVEGDLGMRYTAESVFQLVGARQLAKDAGLPPEGEETVANYLKKLKPDFVPTDPIDRAIDQSLAINAVRVATNRHAGTLEIAFIPGIGEAFFQTGKDLNDVRLVVGTGGPIINASAPRLTMEAACSDDGEPHRLKPKGGRFLLDKNYVLYAIGLMKEKFPERALDIARKNLEEI